MWVSTLIPGKWDPLKLLDDSYGFHFVIIFTYGGEVKNDTEKSKSDLPTGRYADEVNLKTSFCQEKCPF